VFDRDPRRATGIKETREGVQQHRPTVNGRWLTVDHVQVTIGRHRVLLEHCWSITIAPPRSDEQRSRH
jgi:hypothetical protein